MVVSNVFIFTLTWGNDPIWRSYFSNGLVQPSPRQVQNLCFHEKNTMECHESRWVIQAWKVWGAADLILLIVLLVKRLGCNDWYVKRDDSDNGSSPGDGAFSGGWRFPTKSKTASGVSQKTNGWNLKMGGVPWKRIFFLESIYQVPD